MHQPEILFDSHGFVLRPDEIHIKIKEFGDSYNNAVGEIIQKSTILDEKGEVFICCASRILKNFKMTRRGPFHKNLPATLTECWEIIGSDILAINKSIYQSEFSRDRYLLEVNAAARRKLIAQIWDLFKNLLPLCMGKTTYGLVGASKILFSVLPEIVLPIDNNQWLHVFKTVDIGEVIEFMALDIKKWEDATGVHFNELDDTERLTTLPAVYNVMAMNARN